MSSKNRAYRLAGLAAVAAVLAGSVTFKANALELTAIDYGARLLSAISANDAAETSEIISILRSCGVTAFQGASGPVPLEEFEAWLQGDSGPFSDALTSGLFIVDARALASINCDVPIGASIYELHDGETPVGSSG